MVYDWKRVHKMTKGWLFLVSQHRKDHFCFSQSCWRQTQGFIGKISVLFLFEFPFHLPASHAPVWSFSTLSGFNTCSTHLPPLNQRTSTSSEPDGGFNFHLSVLCLFYKSGKDPSELLHTSPQLQPSWGAASPFTSRARYTEGLHCLPSLNLSKLTEKKLSDSQSTHGGLNSPHTALKAKSFSAFCCCLLSLAGYYVCLTAVGSGKKFGSIHRCHPEILNYDSLPCNRLLKQSLLCAASQLHCFSQIRIYAQDQKIYLIML